MPGPQTDLILQEGEGLGPTMGSVWQLPLPAQNPIDSTQTISPADGHLEVYIGHAKRFFPRIATVIHPKWPRKSGDSSHIFVEHFAPKHELTRVSCRLEEGKTLNAWVCSTQLDPFSQKSVRINLVTYNRSLSSED